MVGGVDEIYKGLWDSINSLIKRRLVFDQKMNERAVAARQAMVATSTAVVGNDDANAARTDDLLPTSGVLSIEGRVTYMKLQGDQLVHLVEMNICGGGSLPLAERDALVTAALDVYRSAQRAASGYNVEGDTNCISSSPDNHNTGDGGRGHICGLPELHPLRLELAFHISSVLLHLRRQPIEAWEAAYPTYVMATEHPARLGPRGLIITQLLRDHLAVIDVDMSSSSLGETDHVHSSMTDGTRQQRQQGVDADDAWCFLRMSAAGADAVPGAAGRSTLRGIAQVKQARASFDEVTTKVLLGTMVNAEKVLPALEQVMPIHNYRKC